MVGPVGAPTYTATDFANEFVALLPVGPMWPRDPDAPMVQFINALTPTYERICARDANLLVDAFPVSPVELLPEWEATLGLPDPCLGEAPTLEQRQQQVAARFIANGGQSQAYFISLASALGYTITITQFAPFRLGQPLGQPLYGVAWAHAWQVNAPTFVIEYFALGHNQCGDPFASWGSTVLQCEIERLAPAHTVVLFAVATIADPQLTDEAGNLLFDENGNPLYDESPI
jgi:uncharacterized protein YmfQ (DUF2313 family)